VRYRARVTGRPGNFCPTTCRETPRVEQASCCP
jgi:hypothetical protein